MEADSEVRDKRSQERLLCFPSCSEAAGNLGVFLTVKGKGGGQVPPGALDWSHPRQFRGRVQCLDSTESSPRHQHVKGHFTTSCGPLKGVRKDGRSLQLAGP